MDPNIFVTRNLTFTNNGCHLARHDFSMMTQYLVRVPGFFLTQVPLIYPKSCLTLHCSAHKLLPQLSNSCLFSLIPHSQSSWPCPFLLVYPPHSLVPICSLNLTSSAENLPHDPASAFSCLAQPLKPGCLTLVLQVLLISYHLCTRIYIYIFFLSDWSHICTASRGDHKENTQNTWMLWVMLRAALNLRWSHLLLLSNSEPKCFDIWLWSNPS